MRTLLGHTLRHLRLRVTSAAARPAPPPLTAHHATVPQGVRRLASMAPPADARQVRYLTQREATDIDQELFNEHQFSVDQLMELAGLSCAVAIAQQYPLGDGDDDRRAAVLVVCGPGNNGGDGLVCARHLKLFGYSPAVFYPVQKAVALYGRLAHQCRQAGVPVTDQPPDTVSQYRLVVDALFGFSFRPPVRPQLEPAMRLLLGGGGDGGGERYHVCSVDVPSGWHVEEGPGDGPALRPDMLVSLTAPKLCARFFTGAHYLGGRFVPPGLQEKYALRLPQYPGSSCVVRLH